MIRTCEYNPTTRTITITERYATNTALDIARIMMARGAKVSAARVRSILNKAGVQPVPVRGDRGTRNCYYSEAVELVAVALGVVLS